MPDFLANRFLLWVDKRVCKTAKVGGKHVFRIIKAIATKKPRAFLLENDKGLVIGHPEALRIMFGTVAHHRGRHA